MRVIITGAILAVGIALAGSAIAAPKGIAIIGNSREYQPILERCALNAYLKGKSARDLRVKRKTGKRRPIDPRSGGPQPDPPGRK